MIVEVAGGRGGVERARGQNIPEVKGPSWL